MDWRTVVAYADCRIPEFNSTLDSNTMPRHLSSVSFLLIVLLSSCYGRCLMADDKAVERWEKEIVSIEQRIAAGESPTNATLFVGSSSIRLWNLKLFFPEIPTANHGFGGSVIADSVQFFDRIVVPVKPARIVLYAGDNDIAAGNSPETVHEDFLKFVSQVEQKLPDCQPIIFISIKPSTRRWAMAEKIQQANALIKASCETNKRLKFADIWNSMLNEEGLPNPDLLLFDGLHMTGKGYEIWTDALRPLLPMPATP
jgi:lysophospholipase L1-like esterase